GDMSLARQHQPVLRLRAVASRQPQKSHRLAGGGGRDPSVVIDKGHEMADRGICHRRLDQAERRHVNGFRLHDGRESSPISWRNQDGRRAIEHGTLWTLSCHARSSLKRLRNLASASPVASGLRCDNLVTSEALKPRGWPKKRFASSIEKPASTVAS